ncbi:Aspartate kinase, monofunctional class [Syntrophomonas zehnderi OL-4]|uniref:Aspartokinase n=1 Tax=Syntrophomonas zehnderi OL-4 TaxID=690567 RepID=A0A0E3W2U2_9FIRM|nr:aspartate kinase [Syntrophomonas zehnderi]CFX20571.1 Aspartate kinase, monofunctional class [Syntrophomonas zehnderi OL-4]
MSLLVSKFGGSSVASIEKITNVALRIKAMKDQGNDLVIVISAMGDTTDELVELALKTGERNNPREMDMLLSTGEQQSAALLALTLNALQCPAVSLTGWQAGIKTDGIHSKARISGIEPDRIQSEIEQDNVVVIAGFQGLSPEGNITTLGRGGSDTSAVALAASLGAERCLIFTDVNGVYTADPRIVKEASKLKQISYEEMLEMASLGAGVLQPRAAEFAMLYNVDIEVISSFNNEPGTIITEVGKMEKHRIVSGIAHDINVAKIALFDVPDQPGIAMTVFKLLADNKINVDMIIQGGVRSNRNDIAFTIEGDELNRALPLVNKVVEKIGASGMSYGKDVAKISIVGAGMQSNPGVAAAMFEALAEANINIHMISTSEIKVSCIVDEIDINKAVQVLHSKFHLDAID